MKYKVGDTFSCTGKTDGIEWQDKGLILAVKGDTITVEFNHPEKPGEKEIVDIRFLN